MIVVDASVAVSAVLTDGPARAALSTEALSAPHLVDSEFAHAVRRRVAAGRLQEAAAWTGLDAWRRLGITRYAAAPHLERIWELRSNLSAYDATYVALAEALGCPLLTGDGRISRAPGVRCPVTVLPA